MTSKISWLTQTLPPPPTTPTRTVKMGISLAIMIFLTSVGIGIIWVILFQAPANTILDQAANQTTNSAHSDGVSYVRAFVDNFLFISIGFGAFTLIVDSAFERDGGGF